MHNPLRYPEYGPFRAEQIHDGDYYELSNGHAIECMPGGRDHADGNSTGAALVISDPDVEWSGIDAGYSPEPGTLRAPDVAVGTTPNEAQGWIKGAPALAIEYASIGQNEMELQAKIADLLKAGTQLIWVVRLTGVRCVEIYALNQPKRVARVTDTLTAPGILRNPIPVKAFFDRALAKKVMLNNLLSGQGYTSLEEVERKAEARGKKKGKAEGRVKGKAEAILAILASRGLAITAQERLQILGCISDEILQGWLMRVSHISVTAELFE